MTIRIYECIKNNSTVVANNYKYQLRCFNIPNFTFDETKNSE